VFGTNCYLCVGTLTPRTQLRLSATSASRRAASLAGPPQSAREGYHPTTDGTPRISSPSYGQESQNPCVWLGSV
jgi:hypothetical protein